MNIDSKLNSGKIVESNEETRAEIMSSITRLFSYAKRKPEVYIVLDEVSNKVWVCLYKEPLEKISDDVLRLEKNSDGRWLSNHIEKTPEKILHFIDPNSKWFCYHINIQLSRLNHDSQDSQ